jgi:hypothetical protein
MGSGFVKRTCQCSLTRAFWTVGLDRGRSLLSFLIDATCLR